MVMVHSCSTIFQVCLLLIFEIYIIEITHLWVHNLI